MEEKILVKSEHYNLKALVVVFCLIGLVIGLIVATAIEGEHLHELNNDVAEYTEKYERDPSYYKEYLDAYKGYRNHALRNFVLETVLCALGMAIIGVILYFAWSRIELVVSTKRVYGKAAFGKRVDLPIDSVSAIGSKWPKGIAVATSSGKIAFLMIKNRDEIHKCVSDLLIERQSKVAATPTTTIKQEIPQSNAEELKKYKELLDMGVITQEEFDAKKKQLLGL